MDKPTILLDLDGVLVHPSVDLVDAINAKFGTSYSYLDITDWEYRFMTEEERNFMYSLWHTPDLYDRYSLSEYDQSLLVQMRDLGRVILVTSPMDGHVQSKWNFCRRYFDKKDIFICSDKSTLIGDILIDDGPHNLEAWYGFSIIYDQPYNQHLYGTRARDLVECLEHIQEYVA